MNEICHFDGCTERAMAENSSYCFPHFQFTEKCAEISSLHALIAEKDKLLEAAEGWLSLVNGLSAHARDGSSKITFDCQNWLDQYKSQPTSSSQKAGEVELIKALEWYAEEAYYKTTVDIKFGKLLPPILCDMGARARNILRLLRHPAEKGEGGA